jgi:hypothetical protein
MTFVMRGPGVHGAPEEGGFDEFTSAGIHGHGDPEHGSGHDPEIIFHHPLTPCPQFFNRDPIDRPE